MEEVVKLVNINKEFGKNKILKHVNLTIPKGIVLGLVGQSGSGKTTLIKIILGIYSPTTGDVFINGKKSLKHRIQKIGFASQEYSFYPRLTVEENMHYYGEMYGLTKIKILERTQELLIEMELTKARKLRSSKLSGGMKRRLDIAIALLHEPSVIILDEPTTGLDVVLREKIWELIGHIKKKGMTIIVSSHDLDELQKHCTEIAFIRQGHVYEPETLKQIKKEYHKASLSDIFKSWYIEDK